MKNSPKIKKIVRFFSSLKIAVTVLLILGVITAVGTITESRYDTMTAQKLVYHSWYMYSALGFLAFVLAMVLVDRWPWKRYQTGFVVAHFGLIILLWGSFVTMRWGIDGSMSFGIGQSSQSILVDDAEFLVFASMDGQNYRNLHHSQVDFFKTPPSKNNPKIISLPPGNMVIDDYAPYAFAERKVVESKSKKKGAAIRFQIQNQFVNVIDWLTQREDMRGAYSDLGPARIVLVTGEYKPTGKNEIILSTQGDKEELKYSIFTQKAGKITQTGTVKSGGEIQTGWMGMVLRVINYYPYAEEEIRVQSLEFPTKMTTQAIKVTFNGETRWQPLNQPLRFFTGTEAYVVEYRSRELRLDFPITLKKFEVGRYQGTMRAASYQSLVDVPGRGEVLISMNEPMKHNGFTFYQASFQQDETGKPTTSILSVNRDPGRFIKYLGSLLVVLGTIIMFYFRNYYFGSKK